MVYFTIFASLILLGAATGFCIYQYIDLVNKEPSEDDLEFAFAQLYDFNYLRGLKETWLVFGIIAGVLFLIFALIILFLRKRIKFACLLIKEASKAIIHVPGTLIWPIFPFLLKIGVVFYCVSVN